ncbi:MAG TPA: cache domain-containing protein [Burkholderiaceae bacterium]|nr:cache domain-containing protein [Burkholderiaceae bacterium]
MPATPASRPALVRQVAGVVAILNLVIGAILLLFLQQSYRQQQEHAAVTAHNLSTVLKENISATIRETDVALDALARDIAQLPDPQTAGPLAALLQRQQDRQPALRPVRVYDAAGRQRYGPPLEAGARVNVADQDYFLALRDSTAPGLALSRPLRDPALQQWYVLFARALRKADGSFDGIVSSEVPLRRLGNAFSLTQVGPRGAMTLVSADELVYARYARLNEDEAMIGKVIPSAKLREYVRTGHRPDSYLFHSSYDGIERLISLQRVFDQPVLLLPRNLYFSVGLAADDYLQKWREEVLLATVLMLLCLLTSTGGAWALLRFWRERVKNQEQLRAFEREHAANEERLRIMQDLHDGVGSTLVSTLMLVQGGNADTAQTVAMLQECLDDMRLAIDTLSPGEPDLLPVLGNFRFRMEARFKGVGLPLRWHYHGLPDQLQIAPHDGLQVLRILQEALTNALRHARAQAVTVDLYFTPEQFSAQIHDDGCGFDAEAASHGHGLGNMRLRAQRIGATLAIYGLQPGTAVDLTLPLPPPRVED